MQRLPIVGFIMVLTVLSHDAYSDGQEVAANMFQAAKSGSSLQASLPQGQQPGDQAAWIASITAGTPFVVVFDQTTGKFDDSIYTGSWQTDPMGTLKGGATYRVTYANDKFTCSGYNQQQGRNITHTSQGVQPENGLIMLYDRTYAFDGMGRVWDHQYGIVGHMKIGDQKPAAVSATGKQRFVDDKGNVVQVPCGEKAFAGTLLEFNPGIPRPVAAALNPGEILGPNNYDKAVDKNYVSLGCGGSIAIAFDKVYLVDVPGTDLYVFEIGSSVEPTAVEISKNGSDWLSVGKTMGSSGAVDIHPYVRPGEKFRYLRLTDLKSSCTSSRWPGADIDAVVAVGCVETSAGIVTPGRNVQPRLANDKTRSKGNPVSPAPASAACVDKANSFVSAIRSGDYAKARAATTAAFRNEVALEALKGFRKQLLDFGDHTIGDQVCVPIDDRRNEALLLLANSRGLRATIHVALVGDFVDQCIALWGVK